MKALIADALRLVGRALRTRTVLAALVVAVIAVTAWWSPLRFQLVDLDRFTRPTDAVTVVDRHGRSLRHARVEGIDRRWVAIEDVSPHLLAAFVAVEDHRFWEHDGVDWRSVLRASLSNGIPGRKLSGASTITQQVIKLVYRRPLGLASKIVEVLRAWVLEERMTKEEILEQYVNRVPFGDRIHGVARASEAYFGRPVSDLTVAQAALLAGIPQAPSATEPRRHLARATRRRDVVLRRMLDTGAIDAQAYAQSVREPVRIVGAAVRPWEAPRYVDRALRAWQQGHASVREGRLRTSLDLRLQLEVRRLTATRVRELEARGVTNGAAMVVANASGEVLAYVGAAIGGPDAPAGQMDLLRSRRQPGSTLKPFVYAQLFERGGTPATLLDDTARPMTAAFGEQFTPEDYDRHERGPVRARLALAASLNLPALDASQRVGAGAVVHRLRSLSFSHVVSADHHGAGIVLGGVDVTAEQLAHGYVALARGGRWVPLGWTAGRRERQVYAPEAALLVADILRDARARSDGFGRDLEDLAGGPFALKTGTSTGWRDAWAVAFDERHTVVVWLGDPAGRALSAVSGFEGAAPVATRILAAAQVFADANEVEPVDLPEADLVSVRVCAATGLLPSARCRHRVTERFAIGTAPRARCKAHDAQGNVRWAAPYARWRERFRPAGVSREAADRRDGPPRVVYPPDGERLVVPPGGTEVPLRANLAEARWEVDGARLDGAWWRPSPGVHEIVVVSGGRRSEAVRVVVTAAAHELTPQPKDATMLP